MLGHAHFESHLTLLMMGRGQAWSKSAVALLSTSSVASSYLSGVSCSRSKVNVCCPHSQNAFVFSFLAILRLPCTHTCFYTGISAHALVQDGGERTKKTTFDVPEGGGKRKGKKGLNHLMLARDHSLGRDYIQPGESVDVGDFNWAEPVEKLASPRPPPNDRGGSGHYRHSGRNESSGWGSGQFAFVEPPSGMSPRSPHSPYSPYKHSSPPSDYDPRYPPPPPLPGGDVRPLSSGSFPGPPQPPHGAYPYPPSSSFPPPPPGAGGPRDHSLSGYPLRDASISSSARDSFKSSSSRERSRSYEEVPWDARYSAPQYAYPPPQYQQGQAPRSPSGGMLPYPPPPGGPPEYYQSYGYPDRSAFSRAEGRGSRSPSKSDIPPPPVPPQQWDSQPDDFKRVADIIGQDEQPDERGDKRTNSTRADTDGKRSLAKPLGGLRRKISGGGVMPSPPDGAVGTENSSLARPQPVKRDTSHQCENEETKRRVQRCRLARDHSLAGVALNGGDVSHEALRPQDYAFSDPSSHGESGEKIGGDPTIRALSLSMRQSSIADERNKTMDDASPRQAKPPKLSRDQRLSTVDAVRMAFTDEDDLERMIDSSNKYNDLPNVRKENGAPAAGSATASSGPGAVVAGKPDPLTQMDRVSTSDVMAFNLEKDPSILDASSKPLPIAGGDRMNTGSTVDHIIASVEESVQSVSAELNVELSSDLGLPKPLSISDNDRSTTASSILAPADADDIAQEWLVKDSELTAD